MRRILFITAIAIVVIGLFVALFFVFFGNQEPSLTVDEAPNPFAGSGAGDIGSGDAEDDFGAFPLQGAGEELAPRLIRVTEGPVASGVLVFRKDGGTPVEVSIDAESTSTPPSALFVPEGDTEVRYVERATGNVYAYLLRERTLTRVSNRTIPGVQEATFAPDGSVVYLRYLSAEEDGEEHIETYALPLQGEDGYFLERGLGDVTIHASSSILSLLTSTSVSVGTTMRFDGTNARSVFSTPLSAIIARSLGVDFLVTTKGSAGMDGYAFSVDGVDGAFARILGPMRGLATMPDPAGGRVLHSYLNQGTLRLSLLDLATRESIVLPVSTFAEKCVFSGALTIYCAVPKALSGTLPDAWYQGATLFSDRLWKIDLSARQASLLIDPEEASDVAIDAVDLGVDSAGDALVFRNKRDGSLFVYDL